MAKPDTADQRAAASPAPSSDPASRAAARRIRRFGLGIALVVVVLDQLSKWLVLTQMMTPPRLIEITSFFNFSLAWNRGVSFSMLNLEAAHWPWVLSAVALAITGALGVWLWGLRAKLPAFGVGLVIGGALGNVVDRVRFGAVMDFLDFHYAGYHWPSFNLADTAIGLGVAALLVDALFARRESHK